MINSASTTMASIEITREQWIPNDHYALGDVGNPDDVGRLAVPAHHFKQGDHCFVLRSTGKFTFARILSCEDKGPKSMMTLIVDVTGWIKSVPVRQCTKYIRPLRSTEQKLPSSFLGPRGRRSCQSWRRSNSDPLLPSSKARRLGLGRQHQSMVHVASLSGDGRQQQSSAPSLTNQQSSLHARSRSSIYNETHHSTSILHDDTQTQAGVDIACLPCGAKVPARPAANRSSPRKNPSIQSSTMTRVPKDDGYTQTTAPVSSDTEYDDLLSHGNNPPNPMRSTYCKGRHVPARRRPRSSSRRHSSIRSSITTHVPKEGYSTQSISPVSSDAEDDGDEMSYGNHCPEDPTPMTEEMEYKTTFSEHNVNDNDCESVSQHSSSNSDVQSLCASIPRNFDTKNIGQYSEKRVPSSSMMIESYSDHLEFNEVNLLAALRFIGSRAVTSTSTTA